MLVCWVGLLASVLLVFNLWPRGMLAICFVCFRLVRKRGAGFFQLPVRWHAARSRIHLPVFRAARFWPGLARAHPPSRASLFLLRWEWFRIYFESGVVKIASGDLSWRHLTAMDDYYQNGPLPTWIGWYVQHFPHWFHAGTVFSPSRSNCLCWMVFLPRRFRIACFLHRDALSNRHHSHGELRVSELHRALARISASRRPHRRMDSSRALRSLIEKREADPLQTAKLDNDDPRRDGACALRPFRILIAGDLSRHRLLHNKRPARPDVFPRQAPALRMARTHARTFSHRQSSTDCSP